MSVPAPSPPTKSATVDHVGHLPSSIQQLLPGVQASALIAVLPDGVLQALSLKHGDEAQINDRIATVLSPAQLLPSTESLPPLALLSPCLHAAVRPPLIIRAGAALPPPTAITLSIVLPAAVAQHLLPACARLAARALRGRHAALRDVIPLSATLFLAVSDVRPDGPVAPIDHDTEIAINPARHSRMPIPHAMRAWARDAFAPLPDYLPYRARHRLDGLLQARPPLLLVHGRARDVRPLVRSAAVGLPVFTVQSDGRDRLVSAIARAQLAHPAFVLVNPAVRTDADMLLSHVVQRGHAGHFGVRDRSAVSFIHLVDDIDAIDTRVRKRADFCLRIEPCADGERSTIVRDALRAAGRPSDETEVAEISRLATGFARCDVYNLALAFARFGMPAAREQARLFGGGSVTAPVAGVSWDDVGGLETAKTHIRQLVSASARRSRHRRVGVLLYGPPGTGKTLLARAVAGECQCAFLSVKGPELLDMYVGESEKNVRDVFERAVLSAPAVVFFDEIDALAPSRGSASDSGRVSDRVVSQLLAELDGLSARPDVFVLAASNRPDLVDDALLRPGRLDKLVYVPLPQTGHEVSVVLHAVVRRFRLGDDFSLDEIVRCLPDPPALSGADLYAVGAQAWIKAAKGVIGGHGVGDGGGDRDGESGTAGTDSGKASGRASALVRRFDGLLGLEKEFRDLFGRGRDGDGSVDEIGWHSGPDMSERSEGASVVVHKQHFLEAAREVRPSLTRLQVQEYEQMRLKLENNS